jgi:hypothetical protein
MVVLSVRGRSLFPLFFRSSEFRVSHENKKGGGKDPPDPLLHTVYSNAVTRLLSFGYIHPLSNQPQEGTQ